MEELKIIYEDNHIIVIDKLPNVPVQADISNDKDIQTILKQYLKDKYNKPGNVYLAIVHRLDRPVGGLMVLAKTSKAAARLSKQIREKTFIKTYYAVVQNNIANEGTLTDYLIKNKKDNISYVTSKDKGKLAILNYKKVATINNLSLLEINLITGRSHQIRVQFSSRNNPLYADYKYNFSKTKDNIALFAKGLSFIHPTTKEKMIFDIPLPNRYPFTLFNNKTLH
ncbi:MAG: RluA family pseudouridine synthase [bacterium]|nr:RluA family pseudouridine synthase [bacterium]